MKGLPLTVLVECMLLLWEHLQGFFRRLHVMAGILTLEGKVFGLDFLAKAILAKGAIRGRLELKSPP